MARIVDGLAVAASQGEASSACARRPAIHARRAPFSLARFVALLLLLGGQCVGLLGSKGFGQHSGPATLENLLEKSTLSGEGPPSADEKLAVPAQAAIDEAIALARQAFEDEYELAARDPEPLLRKLLAASEKTADPVRRYAMLLEAEQAAVVAGNPARAIHIVDLRAQIFQVDDLEARMSCLGRYATPKVKMDPAILQSLHDSARQTALLALERDRPAAADVATRFAIGMAKAMQAAARAKKQASEITAAEELLRADQDLATTVQNRAVLRKEYEAARDTLGIAANDPTANGVVGCYRCFVLNDWRIGLRHLAKSDIQALQELAADDMAAGDKVPPDAKAVFAAASKWWKFAESGESKHASAAKSRARSLYSEVCDELADPLDAAIAKKRAVLERVRTAARAEPPRARNSAPVIFDVDSRRGWQAVVDVTKGARLRITASGEWCGLSAQGDYSGKHYAEDPLPNAAHGSLIGRIGTDMFEVGADMTISAKSSGKLELRINDADLWLNDNRGGLKVTVRNGP